MSQLQYKTPNMCEPKGLPRVYFCAHPDNFELLQGVAELLFQQKRCSVWYTDSAEENKEQHNMYLSQMQLVVMPVTFRLLTTESFAFNYEYSYAIEHHIPILPLMLEDGLEDIFCKKCGNIPFVPYHRDGAKAEEFKGNLKQFLDTVVIGDELAERIREDFSAYVFLGYGKSDWQDAQKVMRMIHENEAVRDVGIWCDELFVTEDRISYDIGAVMRKSKLFVMSVTPDLLENKNVLTAEGYRMAVQEKMPVLAMEMLPVSSFKFKWKYKKVASYAKSPQEFAATLREQLENVGVQGKQPSAEHDYLMGLAYLAGVDVVVNHRRAVELITRAAEAGHPKAMERLAVMYCYGMGVKHDMDEAIRWQEKYCNAAQNNLCNVFDALQQCGELYKLAGKQNEAKERDVAAIEYLESSTAMEEKEKTPLFIAIYKQLAEVARISENLREVEEYCNKVVTYMEQSIRERNTIEKKRTLAFAFEDLGDACAENKHFEDAKQYYDKAMEIYTPQMQETRNNMWQHRIAVIHRKLGDLAGAQNQKVEEKQYYEKTEKLLWDLRLRHYGTLQVYFDYAFCKMKLADICTEERDLEAAYLHCLNAGGEFKRLYEEQGSILGRYYQIICESKAGDIAMQKGDSFAQSHREDAVKGIMQLFSEYEFPWMQRGLLEEVIRFSEYWIQRGLKGDNWIYAEEIRHIFDEFLALEERLRIDTAEHQHRLLDCYQNLGRLARLTKDGKATALFCQKAEEYKEKVFGQSAGVEDKITIGNDLEVLGDADAELEQYDSAENYYKQALSIWEEVAKERLSDALNARVRIYIKLGDFERGRLDKCKASKYYGDAFSAAHRWVKEYDTKEAKRSMATCYEHISFVDGRLYLQKALDLREELVNGDGELVDYYALADCYVRMGNTYTGRMHPEKRTEYYGKALQVREKALSRWNSMEECYKLAHLYLDSILGQTHENKKAYFDRAQAIVEEMPAIGDFYEMQNAKGHFISHLARAAYIIYDAETAADYSEQATKIFKVLVEKYPCKESVWALMSAHFQFGKYWDMVVGQDARALHVGLGLRVASEWAEKRWGREEREFLANAYGAAYVETGNERQLNRSREMYEKLAEDYPGVKKYKEEVEFWEFYD